MKVTQPQPPSIPLHILQWLSVGIALAVVPHALRMPVWIPIMFLCLLAWRLLGPTFDWPLPSQKSKPLVWAQHGLAVVAMLAIVSSYGTLVGRDPGVALLTLLVGFKLLESKDERDLYIINCLGFILLVSNFFYSQTIPTAIYTALVVLVLTGGFISINDQNRSLSLAARFRLSATILGYALPLMLVVFLFFPRVSGPLWGLPKDAYAGMTGVDDVMAPGTISRLLRSDAIAFRVKFHGQPPPVAKLYWRGPVMWFTDGRKWSRDQSMFDRQQSSLANQGDSVHYTITMEPTNKRWLYALELPPRSARGILTTDYQIITRRPIRQRLRYELISYPDFQLETITDKELQKALQLPDGYHQKTRNLATEWRNQGLSAEEIIAKTMQWFNEGEFYYTLTPPLLINDSVDEFLFSTKQGFCEHYASAFAVLMRAAGIPARVVSGYQGANYNPVGDYYNVYQRDAHAWTEVWLPDSGWRRVDPTSAVAPQRILQGVEDALPEIATTTFNLRQDSMAYTIIRQIRDSWDAVNNQWNQWVLGYGPRRQAEFFKNLGFSNISWQGLTASLVILATLILLSVACLIFLYRPRRSDQTKYIYDRFCNKLSRIGLERRSYEGPLDFAQRIARTRPVLCNSVSGITDLYIKIRYGSKDDLFPLFKQQVNHFNPKTIE